MLVVMDHQSSLFESSNSAAMNRIEQQHGSEPEEREEFFAELLGTNLMPSSSGYDKEDQLADRAGARSPPTDQTTIKKICQPSSVFISEKKSLIPNRLSLDGFCMPPRSSSTSSAMVSWLCDPSSPQPSKSSLQGKGQQTHMDDSDRGEESTGGDQRSLDRDFSSTTSNAVLTITGISPAIQVDLTLPFPVKLHAILSHPQFEDCIEWLPHGRSWRVVDGTKFEHEVIHKFFRSGKLTSFMRQVNGWAFARVVDGPGSNSYWHPMFLRGLPCLAYKMKRPPKVKNSAASVRNSHSGGMVSESPDFFRISCIAPLPNSFSFCALAHGAVPVGPITPMSISNNYYTNPTDTGNEGQLPTPPFPLSTPQEDEINMSAAESFDGTINTILTGNKTVAADTASTTVKLSTADIQYLAQQNRLFDLHVFTVVSAGTEK